MKLDIVTVNWNSGRQLRDLLSSLEALSEERAKVALLTVVDNSSTDDSIDGMDAIGFPSRVIRNETNRGFAVACNQGAREGKAPYLLFLNPDTRLYPGALTGPLVFLEENPEFGICGVQMVDAEGIVARSCARFPTPARLWARILGLERMVPRSGLGCTMSEWDHSADRTVDQVIGAFFMVRRRLFEALGGFDERFFVYFEEVDFAHRGLKTGAASRYLAGFRIFHQGGGTSNQVKDRRLFYSLRSRLQYGEKHFSRGAYLGAALGTILIEPWTRLAGLLAGGRFREIPDLVRAYRMLGSTFLRRGRQDTH